MFKNENSELYEWTIGGMGLTESQFAALDSEN